MYRNRMLPLLNLIDADTEQKPWAQSTYLGHIWFACRNIRCWTHSHAANRASLLARLPEDGIGAQGSRQQSHRTVTGSKTVTERSYRSRWRVGAKGARSAVISTPDLGVLAVPAAGVLCAFCCVVDTLPEQCLRRRPRANPLVAAVFRTKRLLRERCSATCPRRRRPGQVRHTQGGLQITADMRGQRLLGQGT
jgi:hypothetical protein